jgi:hypothetical protein
LTVYPQGLYSPDGKEITVWTVQGFTP